MKRLLFSICVLFFRQILFCEPRLEAYLANDLELRRLSLEVDKMRLASKKASINNGINVRLSTGKMTLRLTDGGTDISFDSSVAASIPQANNLSLSASMKQESVDGAFNMNGTSLSLSADIISGGAVERKAALLSARRDVLEAHRALLNRAVQVETEFYSELKSLFDTANALLLARQKLYDDEIEFAEIKAKGYAASSSKYRLAEMDVMQDAFTVGTNERKLEHGCAVFAAKCGASFSPGENPFAFLPSEIPSANLVDIASFPPQTYAKIEQAEWTHKINSLARSAGRPFTLSAEGGYTFKNSYTDSDSADIALSSSWRGISLGAGVSIPVSSGTANPAYTVSAALNPAEFRLASIQKKTDALSDAQERIAIESAWEDYRTSVVDRQMSRAEIEWDLGRTSSAYELYRSLEADMKKSFDAGIITQSEYLSAQTNCEQYRIKLLMNAMDIIIYNNTTSLLFCRDGEIQE